ncbi:MAG: right-handed parallel beta-helix repeat-containing protein, partial [Planctomycetota bacterium]
MGLFGSRLRAHVLVVMLGVALGGIAEGATYYVNAATGNDANAGTSPGAAWASLTPVNGTAFAPGDSVLFAGGQSFAGTLTLDADDSGSSGAPLQISSYGDGWATLDGGTGRGLFATDCSYLSISDLYLVGDGRLTGNAAWGLYVDGGTAIQIDSVDVSGFQHSGVEVGGVTGVTITNVHAHQNGFAGISIGSYIPEWSTDVYIGYSLVENNPGDPTITNNHSGNGIIVGYADGAVVEYCEATNNGWDMPWSGNGPVGIWAWNSNDVTIQHNVAHHNRSTALDGGGFDLDGGVSNSVLQYNLSHNNDGYGYLLCQYSGAADFSNNVVRYNISQDDQYGISVCAGSPNVSGMEIYNNTIYNSTGLALGFIRWGSGDWSDVYFWNNIFVTTGQTVSGASYRETFENNLYWSTGGSTGFWVDGYTDLDAWAAATGQEMMNGLVIGLSADPLLVGMGAATLTDPLLLDQLPQYRLQEGSPCIGAGMEITDDGGQDLWGSALPQIGSPDIGVHQTDAAPAANADNGHYYKSVRVSGGVTWDEAKARAESHQFTDGGQTLQGYLAAITSAEESQFARDVPPDGIPGDGYWLGGYQEPGSAEPDGGWRWVSEEPFEFTNWLPGEPNDGAPEENEDAIHFTNLTDMWNDLPASERLAGYLVEFGGINALPVAEAGGPYAGLSTAVQADVDPDTINLQHVDKWVTVYLVADATGTASVQLDGSASQDPDGDPLSYWWVVRDGVGAEVLTATGSQPLIELPIGDYTAELTVNDGTDESAPDVATISVQAVDLGAVDAAAITIRGPAAGPDVPCERSKVRVGAMLVGKFDGRLLAQSLIVDQPNLITVAGPVD